MMSKKSANFIWFAAYLLVMASLVFALGRYRQNALETYGTAEANAHWQDWRDAAERIAEEGPVSRRPPKSNEPPALMLMRDHFPACLGISLLLSSCLFGWFMICARGAFRGGELADEDDFDSL